MKLHQEKPTLAFSFSYIVQIDFVILESDYQEYLNC
tara:strand:- start:419 stop:526 length:108 start_codon:yes stop_codon:yes gene_type:complete